MSSIESDQHPGFQPLSVNHAWLAILPFLGFGLASLANRLIVIDKQPAFWQALLDSPFLVFNWLVMLGLGIGLYKGAPRWVYSYLGWALLFAWWWSNMSSYGYHWKGELWLLLAGVILFILLLKRSWQPLKALANGLWQDWTFLSFGLYILYSFVYMLFDENHHPRLLMLIAATTLVICLGAWGYYRLTGPLRRVLALLGGLLGATALSVFSEATWDSKRVLWPAGKRSKCKPGQSDRFRNPCSNDAWQCTPDPLATTQVSRYEKKLAPNWKIRENRGT